MKNILFLLMITVALGSCNPSTQITGSWTNPDATETINSGQIRTVLVTALTGRTNARQTVENDLAAALEKTGFKTIKSMEILPPTFTSGSPEKEAILARIKETGANAILTVALIDKDTETRYAPGNFNYAPMPRFGYYGTFWGYYNNWSPTLYSPGYYAEDKVYFIETNLYDAASEELLWSAQSETYNPASLSSFSKEFSKIVVSSMEQEGLLRLGERRELAREKTSED